MRTGDHCVVEEENNRVEGRRTFFFRHLFQLHSGIHHCPLSPPFILFLPPFPPLSLFLSPPCLRQGRMSATPHFIFTHWHSFRPGNSPVLMPDTTQWHLWDERLPVTGIKPATSPTFTLSGVCGYKHAPVPGCSSKENLVGMHSMDEP